MDVTSSSLATAETNVRERDVTMKKFPMSHTTVPSVATGHSLKPSDHADLDVGVLSVPASAITDEEEGGSRGAAHTFKPTTLVQSVTSLCLPSLYPIYRTIHSSLPALLRVSLYLSTLLENWTERMFTHVRAGCAHLSVV